MGGWVGVEWTRDEKTLRFIFIYLDSICKVRGAGLVGLWVRISIFYTR
jgi:hypothetical protein